MHNVYGGTWAAEQEAKCLRKHTVLENAPTFLSRLVCDSSV